MKVKDGFVLRSVCGENVIVATGLKNIDFNNVIALNESAALIFKAIVGKDSFSVEDMVSTLTAEYEVDEETARKDCEALLEEWKSNGFVE